MNFNQHNTIHPDLLAAKHLAYQLIGLTFSNLLQEPESQEYGACTFDMNNKTIKFRVAKITPTKIGQFVTCWKRISVGPIMPYDMNDAFDLLVVSVRHGEQFGQFVFPKNILLQKGVISKEGIGGKRGIRVYPPWDITDNAQAKKTQSWQIMYFFSIQPTIDSARLKKIFS